MSSLPRLRAEARRVIDTLPSTALAWHPVHPILVSGCSEEAILHWDLSDSRHTSKKPNFVIIARCRNFTRIVHRALSTRTANPLSSRARLSQAHDSNVCSWVLTFHPLVHVLVSASNDHMTRFWARERPADAASATCARLRQFRSVAVPGARGGWWNSADTWVARTAESVPGRTMISCLDSVGASVRYPGWAVTGVGSEAEQQEAGAGSWLMPEVVRMAH